MGFGVFDLTFGFNLRITNVYFKIQNNKEGNMEKYRYKNLAPERYH